MSTNDYLEIVAIVGIFLVSFVLIRRKFNLAVYTLLFLSVLLHKELFSFFRWDLMPIRAFVFALFCSFTLDVVLSIIKKGFKNDFITGILKNPVFVFLISLFLINTLSLAFSLNIKASLLLLGFFATSMVLFVTLTSHLADNETEVLKYIKFYIFLAFALTLFGYFQYYLYETTGKIIGALWNIPNNIPRVGATFWDVNHYGALLAALLPVSSVFVLTEKPLKSKIFFFVVSISLLVSLLLTNSRTAWIIEFVAFVTFSVFFLLKKYGPKGILMLVLPIVVAASVIGYQYSIKDSPIRAKIKQYFHYRLDSFDSHMLLLQGAFEIYEKYPVLGGGYGSFFEHFSKTKVSSTFFGRDPAALNTRVPAHTIWGELLSGTGILGLSAFLLFSMTIIGTLIYASYKANTKSSLINMSMAAVLIGWLVGGVFYSYNSEFFWIIFALFFSYGVASLQPKFSFSTVLNFFYDSPKFQKFALLFIAVILIFFGLGSTHLIPWDEAIYAKIAKNMLTTGDFLSMHWRSLSSVWYEKPPLYMWLEAGFMFVLGISSWAVRLPSAVFGFLTIAMVYSFAQRHWGKVAGFVSALCLMTTTQFIYYSRTGMTDVTITFFIVLCFYLYFKFLDTAQSKYWLFSGVAAGFALMTKGAVGVLPILIIFANEIITFHDVKRIKYYFQFIFAVLLISMPWHLYMYKLYGVGFLNNYIGYHVFDRAVTAIEDKQNAWWWYFVVIKVSMRIWAVSLIPAVILSLKFAFKDKKIRFLVLWAAIIMLLFSTAQSKLVWYIIPIYPALAMINGIFGSFLLQKTVMLFNPNSRRLLSFLILTAVLIFSLTYFSLNKNLVYPGNLTKNQAELMLLKEKMFGTSEVAYLDRIEEPLALFYLDGPFEIIDFSPNQEERVPDVPADQKLILITKQGRYKETVAGYTYAPVKVQESGDWVLWYMPARIR